MKYVLLACLLLLAACGKDGGPTNQQGVCEPQAVADSGGDWYLELGNTDVAQLGVGPAVHGLKYTWKGPDGLSDYHSAQPYFFATKPGDFHFELTVTSDKCGGSATSLAVIHVLDEPKMDAGNMSVKIKDRFGIERTYNTGYAPSRFPKRTTYVHIPKAGYGPFRGAPEPDELDFTPPNFLVHQQPEGSCWAEGASSSGTANVWYFFKELWRVSAQRIIDCSGFGSAHGGGQIATGDFKKPKGLVDEAVYTYDGHDHKCDLSKSIFRRQALRTFEITSESGGEPSVLDHKHAMIAFGSPEVCGAAGVMGNGDWRENVGTGGTNHCYARFLFLMGEKHGHAAGFYFGEQNSWGKGWGGGKDLHAGQGAYRVADASGKWLRTSIETEHSYFEMDNPCPPPVLDGARMKERTIRQQPGNPQFVFIGPDSRVDQTYQWDHVADIKGASNVAQVFASPVHTTQFKVTANNKCAEAHAFVTVHVIEDLGGHVFEITEHGPKEIQLDL